MHPLFGLLHIEIPRNNQGRIIGDIPLIIKLFYIFQFGILYVLHGTDYLPVIRVIGWIELAGLLSPEDLSQPVNVLNGIAYDAQNDRLFVTGKLWPKLFEIELIAPE